MSGYDQCIVSCYYSGICEDHRRRRGPGVSRIIHRPPVRATPGPLRVLYLQRPLRNLQAPQDPAPAGDAQ